MRQDALSQQLAVGAQACPLTRGPQEPHVPRLLEAAQSRNLHPVLLMPASWCNPELSANLDKNSGKNITFCCGRVQDKF